jgi:hypothetical protein
MGEVKGEASAGRAARGHMRGGLARMQSEVRIGAKQRSFSGAARSSQQLPSLSFGYLNVLQHGFHSLPCPPMDTDPGAPSREQSPSLGLLPPRKWS